MGKAGLFSVVEVRFKFEYRLRKLPFISFERQTAESSVLQYFAVGFNHPFVIGEGVLFIAVERALTRVVDIDIDEAVTLGNLAGGTADQINAAPWSVAENLDAVQDNRILDRLDVLA